MLVILTIITLLPATKICAAVVCCQSVSNFTVYLRNQVAQVIQLHSEGEPGINTSCMQRSGYSPKLDGK